MKMRSFLIRFAMWSRWRVKVLKIELMDSIRRRWSIWLQEFYAAWDIKHRCLLWVQIVGRISSHHLMDLDLRIHVSSLR